MKAMILDVGNSRTKLLAWEGDRQGPALGRPHPPLLEIIDQRPTPRDPGTWAAWQENLNSLCSARKVQTLVTATVVPEVLSGLESCPAQVVVVDHRCARSFDCDIEDLAAVGADRFCNVAAAHAAGLREALVVDVGTATTFDLLVSGIFIGGLIAPGPEFALRMLGREAARLEPVPLEPSPAGAGKNTHEAMVRGGWHTGIGGINCCIEGLIRHHGPLPILLTGGLGHHLQGAGRFHDPHLTLRGAAVLAGLLSR